MASIEATDKTARDIIRPKAMSTLRARTVISRVDNMVCFASFFSTKAFGKGFKVRWKGEHHRGRGCP